MSSYILDLKDVEFVDGGISFICFVDQKEKLLALIAGGSRPAFSRNKVVFYEYMEDKEGGRVVDELLCPRNIISAFSKQNL